MFVCVLECLYVLVCVIDCLRVSVFACLLDWFCSCVVCIPLFVYLFVCLLVWVVCSLFVCAVWLVACLFDGACVDELLHESVSTTISSLD